MDVVKVFFFVKLKKDSVAGSIPMAKQNISRQKEADLWFMKQVLNKIQSLT